MVRIHVGQPFRGVFVTVLPRSLPPQATGNVVCVSQFNSPDDFLKSRFRRVVGHPMERFTGEMTLSVAILTYRHGPFLARTLDAALEQRLSVPWEIVIAEDCSPDDTRAVAERYAAAHPDRIRLLPSERNLGAALNSERLLAACRGKYVAMCEGDDYWTHPEKLARQVAILEADPTVALVHHRVSAFESGTDRELFELPHTCDRHSRMNLATAMHGMSFGTCSIVLRRDALPQWDEASRKLLIGDWPTVALALRRGDAVYLDECWARYRVHPGGLHSTTEEHLRIHRSVAAMEWVLPQLDAPHRRILHRTVADLRFREALALLPYGRVAEARQRWWEGFRHNLAAGRFLLWRQLAPVWQIFLGHFRRPQLSPSDGGRGDRVD
jgi:glycosyltransferase involved in cell wall biosynthesis